MITRSGLLSHSATLDAKAHPSAPREPSQLAPAALLLVLFLSARGSVLRHCLARSWLEKEQGEA
jgi:hypothetical protein